MEQRDFFISYTNADEAWAVWIANVLKSNGYTVYIQALDIKPGDNFLDKMNEFLKNSKNFIAVWSERYPKSRFCMAELQSAFYAWNQETMNCLLPVRIDSYPLEPLYAGLVYVDLPDRGAASETKLVNAVSHTVPRSIMSLEDAETLYEQGEGYFHGIRGVKKDYAKAREYFEQAAAKGNTKALINMGYLYSYGLGVALDYIKAREYFEQAAAKGSVMAANNLGWLYEHGYGVVRDYAKAREYYEQAAKDNISAMYALYNMGRLYEYGQGVTRDYFKASECYQKAAAKGHKRATEKIAKLREKMRHK